MCTGHCADLIPKVPYTLVYLSVHIEYTGFLYLLTQVIPCSASVSIPIDMTSKQVPEHKIISVVIFLPCFDVKNGRGTENKQLKVNKLSFYLLKVAEM